MIVMWWVTGKLRPRLRNSSDIAERLKNTRYATEAITGKNSASLMLRPADEQAGEQAQDGVGDELLMPADPRGVVARGEAAPPCPIGQVPEDARSPEREPGDERGDDDRERDAVGVRAEPRDTWRFRTARRSRTCRTRPRPAARRAARSRSSGTPMSLPPTSLPVRAAYAAAATPPANAMCGPKTGPKATKVRKLVPAPAIAIASPAIPMNPVKMKACRAPIAAAKNPPPAASRSASTSNVMRGPSVRLRPCSDDRVGVRSGAVDGGGTERTIAVYTSAYKYLTTGVRRA